MKRDSNCETHYSRTAVVQVSQLPVKINQQKETDKT